MFRLQDGSGSLGPHRVTRVGARIKDIQECQVRSFHIPSFLKEGELQERTRPIVTTAESTKVYGYEDLSVFALHQQGHMLGSLANESAKLLHAIHSHAIE